MKVLHVLGSLGPLRGGPSFVLRNLAAGLVERGVETHVVTTDDNGRERLRMPLNEVVLDQGVKYRYFPRQLRPYTCSVPLAQWLWENTGNFDLVHIHAVFTFASTAAAWSARARRIPYIVRPLGVLNQWGLQNRRRWAKKLSFRLIERGVFEHAELIHYTSDQERLEAEQAGAHASSIVIANPVDLKSIDRQQHAGAFRARYPEIKDRKLVVFLSRISPKKGLDLLVGAFARLHQQMPEAMLVIAGAGDTDLIQEIKQRVSDAGLSGHVLWPGFLEGDEKAAALADADVFVLPSYSENFGVAVVEALSYQAPVIVSDQVGIHREISSHRAGLVVPCDSAALAAALLEILSKPALGMELALNGARLANTRFSREGILDALMATYQKILAPKPFAPMGRTRDIESEA
jgi:glycosyltransferase involved in cell wall biosynthesis